MKLITEKEKNIEKIVRSKTVVNISIFCIR